MNKKRLLRGLQAIFLIAVVVGLYGCGSAKRAEKASDSMTGQAAQADKAHTIKAQTTAQAPAAEEEAAQPESPNINTEVGYNLKIIKNGQLQIQTKDFKKCVEDLIGKVQNLKGYVESSNISGNSFYNNGRDTRSASLTVRIPQKHFDSFMNKPSEFGNIIQTSSDTKDITAEYVDTEIRLRSLKTRHQRLLELLKQSGSLKDLFTIEQELGEVTYEIEKLSGTLKQYDQLVDMSTIHIQIEEVYKLDEIKPVITFGDKIEDTFKQSVEGLKRLFEGIVLVIVAFVPFLVIIVPLAAIVFIGIKRNRKRIKSKFPDAEKEKE